MPAAYTSLTPRRTTILPFISADTIWGQADQRPPLMSIRKRTSDILDRPFVGWFIIGVIIFNAILLGLETSATVMGQMGPVILALDAACLAIFTLEIAAKLFAMGRDFSGMGGIFSTSPSSQSPSFLAHRVSLYCEHYGFCGYFASSQWHPRCGVLSKASSLPYPAWDPCSC